jgi:hypothetical protein
MSSAINGLSKQSIPFNLHPDGPFGAICSPISSCASLAFDAPTNFTDSIGARAARITEHHPTPRPHAQVAAESNAKTAQDIAARQQCLQDVDGMMLAINELQEKEQAAARRDQKNGKRAEALTEQAVEGAG